MRKECRRAGGLTTIWHNDVLERTCRSMHDGYNARGEELDDVDPEVLIDHRVHAH